MNKNINELDLNNFWKDSNYSINNYTEKDITEDIINEIEQELKYKLPSSYIELMKKHNGGLLEKNYYPTDKISTWGDGIMLEGLFGIGKEKDYSLLGKLGSKFWLEEWNYPNIGIAFCSTQSGGHDMIFFDYRDCGPNGEPKISQVDEENNYKITVIADNFLEFISNLTIDKDSITKESSNDTNLNNNNIIKNEKKENFLDKFKKNIFIFTVLSFVNFCYTLINVLNKNTSTIIIMSIFSLIPIYLLVKSVIMFQKNIINKKIIFKIKIATIITIFLTITYAVKFNLFGIIMFVCNFIFIIKILSYTEKSELLKDTNNNKETSYNLDNKMITLIDRFLKETEKECYEIKCVDGTPDILDNKIGGKPYLPVGEEYPKDKNGDPMPLLIQINLKEINLENWPNQGILEIFACKNYDYPTEFIIKHYKDGLEYQTELPEIDRSLFFVNDDIKIELNKSICNMSIYDYRANKILCNLFKEIYNIEINNYYEIDKIINNNKWIDYLYTDKISSPSGSVGGYCDFTQEDPRVDTPEEKRTECLIKIDSYLNNKLNIGDSGIIFSFITPEDLKNSNFEKATIDWDCY